MNKRFFKIFLLFTILILFFGIVSAEDEEINVNDLNIETNNEDISISNDNGNYNFTWLENEIDSKNIVDLENKNVKWNDNGSYIDGLTINKTITIKNGIIDGSNNVRIFNITNNGDLLLDNITLINGYANDGGAIYNQGNLTIIGGEFINNTVSNYGGVIYNTNTGILEVINGTFKNNTAINSAAVIYNNAYFGSMNILGGTFTNNKANYSGGVIQNIGATINISGGEFNNNYADRAGVIYNTGTINIISSSFNNNKAKILGGAIINSNAWASLNVTYSIFYNNSIENSNETINTYLSKMDLSKNFWGTNDVNFTDIISSTEYNLTNYFKINLVLDASNETLYLYDNLPYYVDIKLNDSSPFDMDLLADIYLDLANIDMVLDSFIAQENTINSSRETFILNSPLYELYVYYFDNSIDSAIYEVKEANNITINLNNQTSFYNNGEVIGNVSGLIDNDNISLDLWIDNSYYSSVLTNNNSFTFNLNNRFPIGTYKIEVKENGTGKYNPASSNNASLTISKATPILTVEVTTLGNLNTHARIYLVVNYLTYENITIKIFNNEYETEYNKTIESGSTLHEPLPTLTVGTYNITVTFNGNENYTNAVASAIFNITNLTSVNITFYPTSGAPNENMIITANITSSNGTIVNNGTLIISIDNVVYQANVTNGIAIFNITTPNIERVFNLDYSYNGLGVFEDKFGYLDFTVSKINTTLNVNIPDASIDENATITINIPGGDATGNVNITVGNLTYNSTLINGSAIITLPILASGNYNVTVEYYGDNKYKSATFNGSLTVKSTLMTILVVENVIMYYHDGSRLIALLTDNNNNPIKGVNITFLINGMNNTRSTNDTGYISIALNLNPGEYAVVTTFNGYGNYSSATTYSNVTIHSTLSGDNIIKYFRNETQYYATLIDSEGKPLANHWVIMNINGVMYNRSTNGSGVLRLSINLDPGTYTITVEHPISEQKHSNNITVLSRINGTDITKYYRNGTQYYATLVDDTGNPLADRDVVMNINGVFYTRQTDENGTVMLSINLNPGEYIITVIDPLTNQTYSNNIKVLATLTGSDLEKNFSESAAYEVKLVDGHGNPIANQTITINIHGVFYNRTTGSDGIARLNINLDPGSYIATAYYNDYATSNQIQVKP